LRDESGVVVVHSSDLHLTSDADDGELAALDIVVEAAQSACADVLLLAGDIFDHNRLPLTLLDHASRKLADAGLPILILPGNHDCLVPDSVYRRGGLADPENVWVFGISVDDSIVLPDIDLEVWGRAHQSYGDMSPLTNPRSRSTRWQIATAHGHWVRGRDDLHRSYLIRDEEIAACGADYVALGHWDVATSAGSGAVPAYYSGAPTYAGTVNVVRLSADGAVDVSRRPVRRGGVNPSHG
jgi:DNA repair exonuclease SbcCD nuclease subunit